MNRLILILTLFIPVLLYGQGNLSKKINDHLKPIKLPQKSWSDTTLGWSTSFQYHQKKSISKYYQCVGAYHLYEYVVTENNGTFQLDRIIYFDSIGNCYSNIDSLRNEIPRLTKQLNYSVIYDSSFNILQIVYRSPIVLKSQQLLLEAHENYIWEEMQYGQWLNQVRDSMLSEGELPIPNTSLSPMAKECNDSILNLMALEEMSAIQERDSVEQVFNSQHKSEIDSCEWDYMEGEISAIQKCKNCYNAIIEKYNYNQYEYSRLRELNEELFNLTKNFDSLIAKADREYTNENWEEALNLYREAHELDEESQYPIKQIEKIKQLTKPKKH